MGRPRCSADAPLTMTCLSTHDAKRSEDVRARLGVLSEVAGEWSQLVNDLRSATSGIRPASLDGRTENLLWQTLAGTWSEQGPHGDTAPAELPGQGGRAKPRAVPAGLHRTTPSSASFALFAAEVIGTPALAGRFGEWTTRTASGTRAATLGCKLVQLMLPGVADVYQGTESVALALVDPDNRRPVDFTALAARLQYLDTDPSSAHTLEDEKLLLCSRALRVRREQPEAFVGPQATYDALACSSGHAFAFSRGVSDQARVVIIATRLATTLERLGGWQEHSVSLPAGKWRCVLGGRTYDSGLIRLADLLNKLPVALLVRQALHES